MIKKAICFLVFILVLFQGSFAALPEKDRIDRGRTEGAALTRKDIRMGGLNFSDALKILYGSPEENFGPVYVAHIIKAPVSYNSTEYNKKHRSLAYRGKAPAQTIYYVKKIIKMDVSPIILKYSKKYKVDPHLIKSVIWAESGFKTYVVSPYGAGGLMQLMPSTAGFLGARNCFNPEDNIAAGTKYLKMLYDKFKSTELVLAAYNAGPGNVKNYGGIPPFKETREYVYKVLNYYQKSKKSQACLPFSLSPVTP